MRVESKDCFHGSSDLKNILRFMLGYLKDNMACEVL
jgi:hypothetical protein